MTTNACVTGASGFIGRALALKLQAQGFSVNGIVRDPTCGFKAGQGVRVFLGDVLYPRTLERAMHRCDVVYHCAALGAGTLKDCREVNVDGTANVIRSARAAGVKRVVHVSSTAVYGDVSAPVVDESFAHCTDGNAYSQSKAEGERTALGLAAQLSLECAVAQPTCVHGPGSPVWTLMFFDRVKHNRVHLIDQGKGLCNLVYAGDVVETLMRLAEAPEAVGERFIVNGQERITWGAFLSALARLCGKEPPRACSKAQARLLAFRGLYARLIRKPAVVEMVDFRLMTGRTFYSAAKLERRLGFAPRTTLSAAMAEVLAWLTASHLLMARKN